MAALNCEFFRPICRKGFISRLYSSNINVKRILTESEGTGTRILQGWVSSVRKMKDVIFLDVCDGSSPRTIQVVVQKSNRPSGLSNGCSLQVKGPVTRLPNGQLELAASEIKVLGTHDAQKFPFPHKQNHQHDYCRQHLHFRPKLAHFQSVLRVRHRVLQSMHAWFDSHDFLGVHTPILTSNDCEGAGETFHVLPNPALIKDMKKKGQADMEAFFGSPAYLSVSGQLHLEAITRGFTRCYSISPTFRAENSKSRLHLSEFYMVEAEEAFVDNIELLLQTIENFVRDTILKVIEKSREDLEVIWKYDNLDPVSQLKSLEEFAMKSFIRLPFDEACAIVKKEEKFSSHQCENEGLSKEHELFLVEYFQRTPVFVIDWPAAMKPFYMKTAAKNELVSAVDLLVPNVGELCGGSLREDNVALLEKKLADHQILDSMRWYLDIRSYRKNYVDYRNQQGSGHFNGSEMFQQQFPVSGVGLKPSLDNADSLSNAYSMQTTINQMKGLLCLITFPIKVATKTVPIKCLSCHKPSSS